jgi:hypothetical protein
MTRARGQLYAALLLIVQAAVHKVVLIVVRVLAVEYERLIVQDAIGPLDQIVAERVQLVLNCHNVDGVQEELFGVLAYQLLRVVKVDQAIMKEQWQVMRPVEVGTVRAHYLAEKHERYVSA